MQRIHLVLSFDHELSLGGVRGSYDDNLFRPTSRILDAADRLGIPITLFTDVLCGIRFREWGVDEFNESYEAQLASALGRGHDVQLHLHPHWLDTTHDGRTFRPSTRYSLHDFRAESYPRNIPGIVEQGVRYLRELLEPIDPGYRCLAFRAGGFNLHPSTGEILSALRQHGIGIDSSISHGYRFESEITRVDYTRVPERANWFIPLDGSLDAAADDGMFEVPVVSVPRTPWNNLPALALRLLDRSRQPPATGVPLYEGSTTTLQKLRRLAPRSSWMLSFDRHYHGPSYLVGMLERYAERYPGAEPIFASAVSHPKSMGPANLEIMEGFVEQARDRFGERLVFCTYPQIQDRIAGAVEAAR